MQGQNIGDALVLFLFGITVIIILFFPYFKDFVGLFRSIIIRIFKKPL